MLMVIMALMLIKMVDEYFLFVPLLECFRLLDDIGHEVEMTDSRLQQTLLKIEKVLRLSDGN